MHFGSTIRTIPSFERAAGADDGLPATLALHCRPDGRLAGYSLPEPTVATLFLPIRPPAPDVPFAPTDPPILDRRRNSVVGFRPPLLAFATAELLEQVCDLDLSVLEKKSSG